MNAFLLVARREFLTRVRKKSFLVMTILGPIFFAALMVVPVLLEESAERTWHILVLDNSYLLANEGQIGDVTMDQLDPEKHNLEAALNLSMESDAHDGLLYLPPSETGNPQFILNNAVLYNKGDLNMSARRSIERFLQKAATSEKLTLLGVDPSVVASAQTEVNIDMLEISQTDGLGEEGQQGFATESSDLEIKMVIGFASTFMIYMFIFLYATQIMRGVIEEKTSRIVEVIISSIKPMQLMMGKIIGIASVGMLQFFIWILLTSIFMIAAAASGILSPDLAGVDPEMMGAEAIDPSTMSLAFGTIQALNLPLILACFVFYFIGGYLMYGALFAAVGAAVDSETDTQQFMLPLTMPMILSFILATRIMQEPGSDLSFWLSIIPSTSPVSMMMRLPFGVPMWEMALSMTLLVLGFLFTTWLAGRIYRIGILTFGKKVTYRDLWRWIRMKP
ncbi:MAG: ABC transporter permease [Bacteroidetes bacterium]|nr:ABC transporter permease [Bacteroidota bacterium]